MPKNKKSRHGPPFHHDFKEPTTSERREAIGSFPWTPRTVITRNEMITNASYRLPEFNAKPEDLDEARLYKPAGRRPETTLAVPKPRDEQDWLVNVPEEGQTFDDYAGFQMSRAGRMRPIANATRDDIVLLPIVQSSSAPSDTGKWPDHGVPLDKMVSLALAYFNRPVRLLPPAKLSLCSSGASEIHNRSKGTKATFEIRYPTSREADDYQDVFEITGRIDPETGRSQCNINSLLNSLVGFRDGTIATQTLPAADGGPPLQSSSFCVMALTMEDLYQSPTDLFISGFAYGGSKVALFSFARYHPHIKIHPGSWYDYGYGAKADGYSYFDDSATEKWTQQRERLLDESPTFESLTDKSKSEFYRRCGKILVHELMHLYGLGHCIFNRCIMMGTGHLVEDFAAPFHLCPVCLRKMQWRLGFSVVGRYKQLADAYHSLGLEKEEKWTRKQIEWLEA